MENFWQACSSQLEQELTPQQYSAWIKPLTLVDYEDGRLRIGAPNRFKLDWVKTQFAGRITELATQFWDDTIDVQFIIDPKINKKPAPSVPAMPREPGMSQHGNGDARDMQNMGNNGHNGNMPAPPEASPRRDQSRINPDLTFDSFVTGKANQLARAAAIQVANNP
ncbi:MAG: DnaA N-terminal domain-containing protein, partial [Undibacterium sp.]|nr:DnaA N-terminal domain-containing protein [Undibacterium sp.]